MTSSLHSALAFEGEDDGGRSLDEPRSVHLPKAACSNAGYASFLSKVMDTGRAPPVAVEFDSDEVDEELPRAHAAEADPVEAEAAVLDEMVNVRSQWVLREESRIRLLEAMEEDIGTSAAIEVGGVARLAPWSNEETQRSEAEAEWDALTSFNEAAHASGHGMMAASESGDETARTEAPLHSECGRPKQTEYSSADETTTDDESDNPREQLRAQAVPHDSDSDGQVEFG